MKISILESEIVNPGDISWAPVAELGETEIYPSTKLKDIAPRTADADVVVVNQMPFGPKEVAKLGRNVRLVAVMSNRNDTVDREALEERGIVACNVPCYSTESAAQHTMGLLLELVRHIARHAESVREGQWALRDSWSYCLESPDCLHKKVMGIIGFGNVGRRVGHLAHAFGMEVLATTRTPRNPPAYVPFSFVPLDSLLQRADIITLHCSLTPETKEIINKKSIARMKDGVYILNIANGKLINEKDCVAALKSGKIAGMGLDVLPREPADKNDPLVSSPNVLVTPHMAWASTATRTRLISLTGENIRRWMQGTPVNLLTKLPPKPEGPEDSREDEA